MSGTKLVRYDDARRALVACTRVDEVKEIADQAEALRAYAKQRRDVEMERWVAEIKLRANMRIGELSRDLEKAPSGPGRGKKRLPNDGKAFKFEVLKAAGITTSVAHRCEGLAQGAGKVEAYIEEQTQQVAGSVDEKLPYLYMNAVNAMPEKEIWIVMGGDGARVEAVNWLKCECAKVAAKTIRVLSLPEARQRIKSLRG